MCPGWGTPELLVDTGQRASAAEKAQGSWVEIVLRYQLSGTYDLAGIHFAVDGTTVCAAGKSSKQWTTDDDPPPSGEPLEVQMGQVIPIFVARLPPGKHRLQTKAIWTRMLAAGVYQFNAAQYHVFELTPATELSIIVVAREGATIRNNVILEGDPLRVNTAPDLFFAEKVRPLAPQAASSNTTRGRMRPTPPPSRSGSATVAP